MGVFLGSVDKIKDYGKKIKETFFFLLTRLMKSRSGPVLLGPIRPGNEVGLEC